MKKKLIKNILSLVMIASIMIPVLSIAITTNAQTFEDPNDFFTGGDTAVNVDPGLGNEDPRTIVANLIKVLLGFLGIIAVIIILLGGFKWMTAGGNEEKVSEARKLIFAGIIGLIIILASWGIANFVVFNIWKATGPGE